MTQTYFRAQTADRDTADLIDPAQGQVSYSWHGPESYDRPGVSACESLDALVAYLAQSGIPIGVGEWVIVEMEADEIDGADPMDADCGEVLVYPTAIVSVRPMDDDVYALIGAAYDSIYGVEN